MTVTALCTGRTARHPTGCFDRLFEIEDHLGKKKGLGMRETMLLAEGILFTYVREVYYCSSKTRSACQSIVSIIKIDGLVSYFDVMQGFLQMLRNIALIENINNLSILVVEQTLLFI